jgi:aconitate hydratase
MNLSDVFYTLRSIPQGQYYSLPTLAEKFPSIRRLPITLRIILESLLRHCDEHRVTKEDVKRLACWNAKQPSESDVPFIVSRVILQDFTGVPLLVDLAAMRDAVVNLGYSPSYVEPLVPVDLVIDHSVQVDHARTKDSFAFNLELEFERNRERYAFLKWGQQAFKTLKVVPPGIGIVHQVNLENIATVITTQVIEGKTLLFPDTLVGTDSHTTMINGLGVLGWGVGGIEAEAAMLGQPVSLQTPEVIGVHLSGKLKEGVTATDLTLRITEMLRHENVVGKFVEFFGEGAASLSVADRATIGNMAPEYGATLGFFPADEKTLHYLQMTGREKSAIDCVRDYLVAQQLFGIPKKGEIDFTKELELDLSLIRPSVSGPKRPQDRIDLPMIKNQFKQILLSPFTMGGYNKTDANLNLHVGIHTIGHNFVIPSDNGGKHQLAPKTKDRWSEAEMVTNRPFYKTDSSTGYGEDIECDMVLTHGSIVIAAITSCTNTSNPSVMLAAGLLAKKAVEKGLTVHPMIKTSLAPGSRVVTDYLLKTNLQHYLDKLGFELVGYGCTTCIGNSGPLDERIETAIQEHDLITASVLSGNRNFEARIHSAVKANFLMSPPLVVAFAIAGTVNIDLDNDPIGVDQNNTNVFLRDIWPSDREIEDLISSGIEPSMFRLRYVNILKDNPIWQQIETASGERYEWDLNSSYIQKPPYFDQQEQKITHSEKLKNMRCLAVFGDSVTTDHISPAGAFHSDSPAGQYLLSLGISKDNFNSYGSRRGNHEVMMRGTFANIRLRNQMADGQEGGYTKLMPAELLLSIFDACQIYMQRNTSLIIFAGKDYGMGSSRDWAAKGPALLGVKAIIAKSFERIHRSNLIGMGILPLQFKEEDSADALHITGNEVFSLENINKLSPQEDILLKVERPNQEPQFVWVLSRLDTSLEVDYYQKGGILPYMLEQLVSDPIK